MKKRIRTLLAFALVMQATQGLVGAETSSTPAAQALTKLLASGRLPPERTGAVVALICSRGGSDDLAKVFDQAVAGDYDSAARLRVLELLTDAAVTRKVRPSGDLSTIEKLMHDATADRETRLATVKLASVWRVTALAEEVIAAATDEAADAPLRRASIDALAVFGTPAAKDTLAKLATGSTQLGLRSHAAIALAKLDLVTAAKAAAPALAAAETDDAVAPLMDAFLTRKGGPDKLAAALRETKLAADPAKLALRYMYSVGRSDASLSDVLTNAAGIGGDVKPPSPDEMKQLIADVAADGDAARGEQIFRRADLSCMKCHAVSRAGGSVGPDLSAVGSISPVDYLINSIVDPNLAIKEQFVTRVIITADGETFTGIIVDRDDVRVNLRDAAGKIVTIPTVDIDEEAEGRSLMPQGLTKFLTRQELIDVVRFLSELGKPGPYAIRKVPTIQRWRVMKQPPAAVVGNVPDAAQLNRYVSSASAEMWIPAYGMVGGTLPVAELGPSGSVVYLQGEIEVVKAGEATLSITPLPGMTWWIDGVRIEGTSTTTALTRGRHAVTLRVIVDHQSQVTVEVKRPAGGSAIEFDVVGGS